MWRALAPIHGKRDVAKPPDSHKLGSRPPGISPGLNVSQVALPKNRIIQTQVGNYVLEPLVF